MRLSLLRLGLAGAIAGGCLAAAPLSAATSAAEVPPGFTSNMANVNGVRLHFVSGGAGPALILIHGFPQDWTEYRAIMPRLAKRFTVMALDLRGIGQSSIASGGYDADTLAKDVYELAKAQKLDDIYVVGHDLGGQVAYAFARQYPSVTRGAMLLDAPLPGIDGWDDVDHDPSVWHIHFMQVPGLPEKLLAGRQNVWLDYFLQFGKFSSADKAGFLRSLRLERPRRRGAGDLPRLSRQRPRQRRRQRAQRHADHHRHRRQIAVRSPHPDDGGWCATPSVSATLTPTPWRTASTIWLRTIPTASPL
jgi:pimeloyl-ACP methyl ester carboxylesterase